MRFFTYFLPLVFISILASLPAQAGAQQTILTGGRGGTGFATTTVGNIGKCLAVLTNNPISWQITTCGSGGGGGGSGGWTFIKGGIYNSTTTDQVLIGEIATTTTAKLEVNGGIFASASSTFTGPTTFLNASTTNLTLGSSGLLWMLGITSKELAADVNGKVYGAATTTAGTGLTFDGTSFNCNTASASVFGCLASVSFSKFNSATTTFTYPLIYTPGTNAVTFPATSTLFGTPNVGGQVLTIVNGNPIFNATSSTQAPLSFSTSTGAYSLLSPLQFANGGTGATSFSANQLVYTNAANTAFVSAASSTLFGTGTGGQFLVWANGVPTWTASTTYAAPLTFGTSTGQVSLQTSGVTAGAYTNTNLTVDANGRITTASNGSAGSSGGDPFTHPLLWQSATTSSLLIGTSTAVIGQVVIGTSTAPQLMLVDNSQLDNQWAFRNQNGYLFIATSTATATSTFSAFSISSTTGQITIENPLNGILSTNNLGQLVASTSIGSNYITGLFANPSGSIGATTATNGTAVTAMRSDGVPACTAATVTAPGCISALSMAQFTAKVGSSTADTAGQVTFWTTTNATPALQGSNAAFTFSTVGNTLLTVTNATTTNLTTTSFFDTGTGIGASMLLTTDANKMMVSSSTPVMAFFNATSSLGSATSTILGALTVGTSTPVTLGNPYALTVSNAAQAIGGLIINLWTNVANAFRITKADGTIAFNVDTTASVAGWGVATTSPWGSLSVVGDGTNPIFVVATSTTGGASSTQPIFMIDSVYHIMTGGPQPTIASCGTAPSVNGNDNVMRINTGTAGLTECIINFAKTWTPFAPVCTVDEEGALASVTLIASSSVTQLRIGLSASLTTALIGVQCMGFQ